VTLILPIPLASQVPIATTRATHFVVTIALPTPTTQCATAFSILTIHRATRPQPA